MCALGVYVTKQCIEKKKCILASIRLRSEDSTAHHNVCVHSCFIFCFGLNSRLQCVVFTPYFLYSMLYDSLWGPLSNVWPLHTRAGTESLETLVGWKVNVALQNISTQPQVIYWVLKSNLRTNLQMEWDYFFCVISWILRSRDIPWNKDGGVGLFHLVDTIFSSLKTFTLGTELLVKTNIFSSVGVSKRGK